MIDYVFFSFQTCSCGHGPYCVHVLFVMVKVLQLAPNHPTLMAGTLKDFEVSLFFYAFKLRENIIMLIVFLFKVKFFQ